MELKFHRKKSRSLELTIWKLDTLSWNIFAFAIAFMIFNKLCLSQLQLQNCKKKLLHPSSNFVIYECKIVPSFRKAIGSNIVVLTETSGPFPAPCNRIKSTSGELISKWSLMKPIYSLIVLSVCLYNLKAYLIHQDIISKWLFSINDKSPIRIFDEN